VISKEEWLPGSTVIATRSLQVDYQGSVLAAAGWIISVNPAK